MLVLPRCPQQAGRHFFWLLRCPGRLHAGQFPTERYHRRSKEETTQKPRTIPTRRSLPSEGNREREARACQLYFGSPALRQLFALQHSHMTINAANTLNRTTAHTYAKLRIAILSANYVNRTINCRHLATVIRLRQLQARLR